MYVRVVCNGIDRNKGWISWVIFLVPARDRKLPRSMLEAMLPLYPDRVYKEVQEPCQICVEEAVSYALYARSDQCLHRKIVSWIQYYKQQSFLLERFSNSLGSTCLHMNALPTSGGSHKYSRNPQQHKISLKFR